LELYGAVGKQTTKTNDLRRSEFSREESICKFNLGRLERREGLLTEARVLFETARNAQESLVREDPARSLLRSDLAATYFELAELLAQENRDVSAVRASFGEALEIQTRLVTESPDFPQFRYEAAMTSYRLGVYEWQKRKAPADARPHVEAAIGHQVILVSDNPKNIKYQLELAKTRDYLALILDEIGEHAKAIEIESKSIHALKAALTAVPSSDGETAKQLSAPLVRANVNQAYSYLKSDDPSSGLACVERALEVLETKYSVTLDDRFVTSINIFFQECETRAHSRVDRGTMKGLFEKVRVLRARTNALPTRPQGKRP
jgi:tetratricopeptide (TPR) repeat protein